MEPDVNLLDCSREPSDEQLENLMREVAADARAKVTVANCALQNTLAAEVAEVRAHYQLYCPPVITTAAT
jgi:hypothetical protein